MQFGSDRKRSKMLPSDGRRAGGPPLSDHHQALPLRAGAIGLAGRDHRHLPFFSPLRQRMGHSQAKNESRYKSSASSGIMLDPAPSPCDLLPECVAPHTWLDEGYCYSSEKTGNGDHSMLQHRSEEVPQDAVFVPKARNPRCDPDRGEGLCGRTGVFHGDGGPKSSTQQPRQCDRKIAMRSPLRRLFELSENRHEAQVKPLQTAVNACGQNRRKTATCLGKRY